jgi:hypothetical protein
VSGPVARDLITVAVLTRRDDEIVAPYAFLLLRYGCEMLQVAIPSEKDLRLNGKKLELFPFPCSEAGEIDGRCKTELLAFHSSEFVRDAKVLVTMAYQRQLPRRTCRGFIARCMEGLRRACSL